MQKENSDKSLITPSAPGLGANWFSHLSPLRLFIIIISSIFVAEIFAMAVVYFLHPFPYYLTTLTDAGIMVVLIFPILYLFSFRPLLRHIERLSETEKALQQKEELNQRFFDSIDTLIAYMDCEFNIIRVNDAFATERAHLPEYFVGKNYFVLYPQDANRTIFQQVLKTRKAYHASESPFESPDQPERGITYWNWSLQPVMNAEGLVDGLVLSQVDVTERKQAQEQIHEMALFPTLNPDPVLQVDVHGRIKKSNPAALQLGLGTQTKLFELIPDLGIVNLSDFIASGSIQHIYEARLGEQAFQWTIRGAPDLELAFLYGQDITGRKRSEEAVRLLSSVVEQTADTVVVTGCDGTIEYVNPAFEKLTGYQKEEVLGQTPRVLKSGMHEREFYRKLWDTVLSGQIFEGELSNRKKNGEILHEVKTITPLRNEQGEITRFVATGKDITERKAAEEKLRRAYEDLEQRVQDRTEELSIANSELEDEINVRRQAEAAWQKSEQRLARAQEIAHLGSWELDLSSDQLTWSDEVYRIFGLQPQEFGATYEAFLEAVHPDDRDAVSQAYFGSIRDFRDTYEIEHRVVKRSNGEVRIVYEKCEHFRDAEGKIVRSVGMVHDITERKKVEMRLQQLNRTLQARSASNQAMLRAKSETELLDDVCKIVVKDCGYAMVWIGYAEDNEGKPVRPVASAGFEAGYLETLNITWADTERGRGPTGTAIRTSKPQGCRNMLTDPQFAPWREEARQRGYYSSLVLPLLTKGQAFGAITIYAREPDAFSTDEEKLLTELASDLTHGIETIRLREIRALIEAQLRIARDELEIRVEQRTAELAAANRKLSDEIAERKEIERQLRIQTAAMEAAANGIIITDPSGMILWTNPAVTEISGYSEADLIGQNTRLFKSGRHEPEFYRQMWQSILTGDVWHGEATNRRKDGNLYIEEETITPVHNEHGELTHFIAIKQDITERKLIYSQLEESNRELKTLTASERQQRLLAEGLVATSMALNMSLELHAVLDHIFEQTRHTIPYVMADIVLIEAEVASVVRQWGFENRSEPRTIFENDNLRLQEFPAWERICETKSVVIIPDTQLERGSNTYFGMTWIRSYLGAPLIYKEQVIGIINLISDQPNAFQEAMAKNLRAFAAPAAMAIQNARLYETEQQNRKAAEVLSAASVALAQTLDIQMVMETILDYVQFILPSDVAFVILSEGGERYRIRAVRAGDDHPALQESLLDQTMDMLSDPIVRSYFAKYENTYIPDSREVPDWHPPLDLGFLNCWLGIPLESMGKILGIVVIAHAAANSFTRNQIQLMEAVVKQAVVALQNAWLFEQVRSGRERLQQLSRHLVEIQENERKYIARELHDETSQSLTSLKIGLQIIEQKAAGHRLVLDQVANLKSLADESLESLHRLAVNLRPASLDHLGLVDALTGLVETTQQRSGINAHFKTMGSVPAAFVSEEMETSIYRIVQESLTNVVRHAQAAHVDIILEWQEEKIVVIIEDDGVGMDLQKARESGRLGVIGMQERAEMLGGKLVVDSAPDVGTTLVVEIPYVHSNTISR